MKFSASPLVVAVALGLLGPQALVPDTEESESALSVTNRAPAPAAPKLPNRRRSERRDDEPTPEG